MPGLILASPVSADGTLTYSFVESVKATYPFYVIRVMGGLYLLGMYDHGLERYEDSGFGSFCEGGSACR